MTWEFPSQDVLQACLEPALLRPSSKDSAFRIVARRRNRDSSTFPSELVTFRGNDGSELEVFCKYGVGHTVSGHGHRGGVAYEEEVYRHVLEPLKASAPQLYGSWTDPRTGERWLMLQYLENSTQTKDAPSADTALALAARWAGQFHRAAEHLARSPLPMLNHYDADYYVGWARRTAEFAGEWHQRLPWLRTLCERCEADLADLAAAPRTVIHGEYTPSNVLIQGDGLYPIDWESAAIAAGEIDLASLSEKWPQAVIDCCEREYRDARWPHGAPAEHAHHLDLARLYWELRWLGDRPEWTACETMDARFEDLRTIGTRLGLI